MMFYWRVELSENGSYDYKKKKKKKKRFCVPPLRSLALTHTYTHIHNDKVMMVRLNYLLLVVKWTFPLWPWLTAYWLAIGASTVSLGLRIQTDKEASSLAWRLMRGSAEIQETSLNKKVI